MEDRKSKILSDIDRDREELEELSRKIHDDPELGFEEFHALSYISDVLKALPGMTVRSHHRSTPELLFAAFFLSFQEKSDTV